jgi:hypothetical protein
MKKKGKFILFSLDEFDKWLNETKTSRQITLLQNHHTYIPGYSHFKGDNHFALLQGMENSHIQRGFAEIAQNITTFPDGTVAICRSFDKIPAGIKGANQGGICMEHLGHFDINGDVMNTAHRDTIIKTNALLCREFNLPTNNTTIVYHHWWDLNSGIRTNGTGVTKTCPGTNFFGGNKVQDADKNFIPLVKIELDKLKSNATSGGSLMKGETLSNLNVRKGNNATATILKTLQKGIIILIYEVKDNWYRIHPKEQQWVAAKYIKKLMANSH